LTCDLENCWREAKLMTIQLQKSILTCYLEWLEKTEAGQKCPIRS
jgi:hypothetical protein